MGVGHVRPARIATKIGPIRLRRVDIACVPPGDRLPSSRNDGANPPSHRIARISGQKIQVTLERISLQGRHIGILGVEVTDRPGTDRGNLIVGERRRRRIGTAIKKNEWRVDF
jgi:hypothetical protein